METPIKVDLSISKEFLNRIRENSRNLRDIFEHIRVDGTLGFKYDLYTAENYLPIRIPKEVIKCKGGHCYELSLLLTKVLNELGYEAYYIDMPEFYKGMHAAVLVKEDNKKLILDPARKIFKARYRKYRIIKNLYGAYYLASAYILLNSPDLNKQKLGIKFMQVAREYGTHLHRSILSKYNLIL